MHCPGSRSQVVAAASFTRLKAEAWPSTLHSPCALFRLGWCSWLLLRLPEETECPSRRLDSLDCTPGRSSRGLWEVLLIVALLHMVQGTGLLCLLSVQPALYGIACLKFCFRNSFLGNWAKVQPTAVWSSAVSKQRCRQSAGKTGVGKASGG